MPRNGRHLDIPHGMQPQALQEAVNAELYRVANATRSDVSLVLQTLLQDERQFITWSRQSRGGPASEQERLLRKLECLKSFEQIAQARPASEDHMLPEWGGGAPT